MSNHLAARILSLTLVVAGVVALTTSPPAEATSALSGSVLYTKADNIYATDGVSTRQITTDGNTPSTDRTGNSGYIVPSESDDGGIVVAARNQDVVNASDQQQYKVGYLWVMNAYGHVIRKFKPPQFAYEDSSPYCGSPGTSPQGILNARVSPDGTHIAYTFTELAEVYEGVYGCNAESAARTTIVKIDGTDPIAIDDGTTTATNTSDLEIGSWVNDNQILIDRADFGEVESYVATLPSAHAQPWFGPASDTDTAYLQGALRNNVLVTDGLSDQTGGQVLRVWAASSFSSTPTYRCEQQSAVDVNNDYLYDPSLSPDGAQVAYEDTNRDESMTKSGQGIYTMATSCGAPQLLVAGAINPFWSPAPVAAPPVVPDTTPPSLSLNAPTLRGITALQVGLRWTSSDSGSGLDHFVVQLRSAPYSGAFGGWSTLGTLPASDDQATITQLVAGRDYCIRMQAVDGAGNVATSASRCVAVALDDRVLTRSSGWQRVTGAAYYRGTATRTSTRHATLTLGNAVAARIGVVVTVGPARGSFAVYDGSKFIGTVNTAATSTHNQVIKWLPAFATRSGAIHLVVTTSGRQVSVDGLVVAHE